MQLAPLQLRLLLLLLQLALLLLQHMVLLLMIIWQHMLVRGWEACLLLLLLGGHSLGRCIRIMLMLQSGLQLLCLPRRLIPPRP